MLEHFDRGIRFFYFFDDTFSIRQSRILEFCEAVGRSPMRGQISWVFRTRANTVTEECLARAKDNGCVQILVGVEDYTDTGLKLIRKGIKICQVEDVIRWARRHGISTSANWIIGLPHHERRDVLNLIDRSIELGSDYAMYSVLNLLPGSQMHEEQVAQENISADWWRKYVLAPSKDYYVELLTNRISEDALADLYHLAYRRFYRRPRYLLAQLKKVRSLRELIKKSVVGLRIIRQ